MLAPLVNDTVRDLLEILDDRYDRSTLITAVGLADLWHLIRWLFNAHWFGYRLRLVRHGS